MASILPTKKAYLFSLFLPIFKQLWPRQGSMNLFLKENETETLKTQVTLPRFHRKSGFQTRVFKHRTALTVAAGDGGVGSGPQSRVHQSLNPHTPYLIPKDTSLIQWYHQLFLSPMRWSFLLRTFETYIFLPTPRTVTLLSPFLILICVLLS